MLEIWFLDDAVYYDIVYITIYSWIFGVRHDYLAFTQPRYQGIEPTRYRPGPAGLSRTSFGPPDGTAP